MSFCYSHKHRPALPSSWVIFKKNLKSDDLLHPCPAAEQLYRGLRREPAPLLFCSRALWKCQIFLTGFVSAEVRFPSSSAARWGGLTSAIFPLAVFSRWVMIFCFPSPRQNPPALGCSSQPWGCHRAALQERELPV